MGATQARRGHEEGLAIAMGDIDPAFQSLVDEGGDHLRGLWRVEKLELKAVPKGQEGKFYEGDCYLHFDKNPNEQHVHFWIGSQCSIDEQAVAAIKAVELDNLFGGLPIQHREVQGFESAMQLGDKFIKDNGLPPQTALTRTFQGGEPEEFKSLSRFGRTLFCLKLDFSFVIVNCFLGIAVSLFSKS